MLGIGGFEDLRIWTRLRGGGRRVPNPQIPKSSNPQIPRSSNPQILDRGFTIIELLVVLSIIVVLATIGMTQYRSSVIRANEAVLMEDLFRLRDAIDQYSADTGQYPSALDALVSDGYIRAIPKDPFTKNTDWQTIPSEADPNNPSAPPGVYNVKSSSDQTALDGTKYSDW
jgi:general secretion pathway protein G